MREPLGRGLWKGGLPKRFLAFVSGFFVVVKQWANTDWVLVVYSNGCVAYLAIAPRLGFVSRLLVVLLLWKPDGDYHCFLFGYLLAVLTPPATIPRLPTGHLLILWDRWPWRGFAIIVKPRYCRNRILWRDIDTVLLHFSCWIRFTPNENCNGSMINCEACHLQETPQQKHWWSIPSPWVCLTPLK